MSVSSLAGGYFAFTSTGPSGSGCYSGKGRQGVWVGELQVLALPGEMHAHVEMMTGDYLN